MDIFAFIALFNSNESFIIDEMDDFVSILSVIDILLLISWQSRTNFAIFGIKTLIPPPLPNEIHQIRNWSIGKFDRSGRFPLAERRPTRRNFETWENGGQLRQNLRIICLFNDGIQRWMQTDG